MKKRAGECDASGSWSEKAVDVFRMMAENDIENDWKYKIIFSQDVIWRNKNYPGKEARMASQRSLFHMKTKVNVKMLNREWMSIIPSLVEELGNSHEFDWRQILRK